MMGEQLLRPPKPRVSEYFLFLLARIATLDLDLSNNDLITVDLSTLSGYQGYQARGRDSG